MFVWVARMSSLRLLAFHRATLGQDSAAMEVSPALDKPAYRSGARRLFNRGFISLSITQFFGAANDNILKQVLTLSVAAGGVWDGKLGNGGQAYAVYFMALPFILFSGFSGQLADRYSKERLAFWVKVFEIFIAVVAFAGFWFQSVWFCLMAMFLLGTHSAFYGPAKYGMIPELVDRGELSRANGIINMMTNLAVIAGTVVAGPVYAQFAGEGGGPQQLWIPGAAMMAVAVAGLCAVLFLSKLPAQNPALQLRWHVVSPYVVTLREMARTPVLRVMYGWALFYLIAAIVLLIISDYRDVLQVSSTRAVALMGVLGVSIGIGSGVAGWISGHQIKPRLIPVGTIPLTVMFLLLATAPKRYDLVAFYIGVMGLFAGCYVIPLQSLLQKLSPDDSRGRFMGVANAFSFVTIIVGAAIFQGAKVLEIESQHVFYIAAALAAVGTAYYFFLLPPAVREDQ